MPDDRYPRSDGGERYRPDMWDHRETTPPPARAKPSRDGRHRSRDADEKKARDAAYRQRSERPRSRRERRTRTAAVVVLVVVALVIAIIGATAGATLVGGDDGGDSPPFSLLPIMVPTSTSAVPDSAIDSTTASSATVGVAGRGAASSTQNAGQNESGRTKSVGGQAMIRAQLASNSIAAADAKAEGIAETSQ